MIKNILLVLIAFFGLGTGLYAQILSAGKYQNSFFLCSDGSVFASGLNDYGQLGDGTSTNRDSLIKVIGLSNIVSVSAGYLHTLFLQDDGTVWATGYNSTGQFGDGTTIGQHVPVQINGLTDVSAIAAGNSHSIFLKNDGTVWVTGGNSNGQLGIGTTDEGLHVGTHTPIQVPGL